tara:strand:- start:87 stop:476 length:390 start_codon:yes stop_codon:yes gene_type:complete
MAEQRRQAAFFDKYAGQGVSRTPPTPPQQPPGIPPAAAPSGIDVPLTEEDRRKMALEELEWRKQQLSQSPIGQAVGQKADEYGQLAGNIGKKIGQFGKNIGGLFGDRPGMFTGQAGAAGPRGKEPRPLL